jgi:hypothetical protein
MKMKVDTLRVCLRFFYFGGQISFALGSIILISFDLNKSCEVKIIDPNEKQTVPQIKKSQTDSKIIDPHFDQLERLCPKAFSIFQKPAFSFLDYVLSFFC